MGEVLAPKRQTVVDRLRRRFDHYRKHHNACLPRYEKSADGLFEKHKQETIMLKQRYLESKAKKSKTNKHSNSSEHKHTIPRDTLSDTQKLLSHPKPVKRPREHSPVILMPSEVATDDLERTTKTTKSSNYESTPSSEYQCKKSSSSLSTQQFPTNGHKSRNKTRQFSPKTKSAKILDSCTTVPPTEVKDLVNSSHTDRQTSLSLKNQKTPLTITNTPTEEATASCNLVSNTSECKQEKEQKSNSTLCQFPEDSVNYNENIQQNQDGLSDTFPSISGLAEDSCEDVLHPDILKDLFDDVFTSSPNMMDFFDDSVGSIKVGEDEDIMNKNDTLMKSSPYESTVDKLSFSIPHVATQQTPGLFANSLTTVSTALTSTKTTYSTIPSVSISSSKGYTNSSQCLPPFNGLSPSHQLPDNLSMDFKLTEPSPAALTLKQMAEQHQSMQQKQQLGRNLESPNRMMFSADPFPDPVPFRNRFFLNNTTTKPSINLFNSTALVSERKYPDMEPVTTFKEESCSERLLESQQRSLIMKPAERKSPCVTSARLGWTLASADHSNTAGHPLDSQYVTADSRTQVSINENHVLGMGFSTKAVQQVKSTDSDIRHQAQQPYSNMYNVYTPQHSSSNGVNPMFSAPVSHSMPYNAQFTSTVEQLPPEFKLDQPNTISLVEQTGQTPTTYQQTYMRHQQIHNQSMNNQWRHVQLPQNNLNVPNYEHHDGYRQLPSHSNQITTTVYHSVNYPYGGVSGHASRPNLPTFSNQPMIQHRQQLNSQFHQRQQLSVEHRVMSAMGRQTLGTETTSHISATSAAVYNITQDSSHINLDFLENINSNTSDLLNFDQVLHGETETTFQLLG